MRSRTVREGSVGLLLLLGLGLFGALLLWLQGVYFGKRNYQFTVSFKNAEGMQIGTPVRYRGVSVGKVTNIKPGVNGVDVLIDINQPDLVIPRDVTIEANKSGFIGENSIDITPTRDVPLDVQAVKPQDPNCNERQLIICNNARLDGQSGVGLNELIRSAVNFTNLYGDPKFFNNINAAVSNTSAAAQGVVQLTRDLSGLSLSVRQDLGNISSAANAVGRTVDKFGLTADKLNQTADKFSGTADKIGRTADQVSGQFGVTANKIGRTADQISLTTNQLGSTATQTANRVNATVDQFRLTANQVNGLVSNLNRTTGQVNGLVTNLNRTTNQVNGLVTNFNRTNNQVNGLVTNINSLITTNQGAIVGTLNNLKQTSDELRVAVGQLSPAINRVTQGELIQNLETLSANAVQASANLRNFSNSLNNPTTLVSLQQTLDSARVTFQNAQKITSDLDDLTGDPAFRNNLRNLVNGLSGLVSSTQQLEQQVEVAQFLEPMAEATNLQAPKMPIMSQMGHTPADTLPNFTADFIDKDKPNLPVVDSTAIRKDQKPISNKSAYAED